MTEFEKVDFNWVHWVIKQDIFLVKQRISYIKAYFMIDLACFKCY